MKTRIIVVLLILMSLPAFAGGDGFHKLYRKYSGVEGVTSIKLPKILFQIARMVGDLDEPEKELIESIDRMWVLEVEDPSLNREIDFTRDCKEMLESGEYEEILRVNEKGEKVHILITEERGYVRDMIILVGGDENVLVRMQGHFDLADIGKLASEARGVGHGL